MTNISEDIIARYVSGRCSDVELEAVRQWLAESPDHGRELFGCEQAVMLACGVRSGAELRRKAAYDRVTARIMSEEIAGRRIRRGRMMRWCAAAAVIVGMVVAGVSLMRHRVVPMVTVAAADVPMEVLLPDSSRVWLNNNASIEYPEQFADNRSVRLRGEAYFEVTHDEDHPFTVDGDLMDVTVLGTRFTFRSCQDDQESFVSLVEGRVKVGTTANDDTVILTPGQKATFDPLSGNLDVTEVMAQLDAVWHDQNIPFRNASITQIAKVIEHLYDVKVHVAANVNKSATYSGAAMRYESVDTTLSVLANTLPISYTISGDEIYISAKR